MFILFFFFFFVFLFFRIFFVFFFPSFPYPNFSWTIHLTIKWNTMKKSSRSSYVVQNQFIEMTNKNIVSTLVSQTASYETWQNRITWLVIRYKRSKRKTRKKWKKKAYRVKAKEWKRQREREKEGERVKFREVIETRETFLRLD